VEDGVDVVKDIFGAKGAFQVAVAVGDELEDEAGGERRDKSGLG
jgi:hypothetical protein